MGVQKTIQHLSCFGGRIPTITKTHDHGWEEVPASDTGQAEACPVYNSGDGRERQEERI